MTFGHRYSKLCCGDGYTLHDVRAVGVGPAVRGRRDRRECVREMLIVWCESCKAGRLLVAKLQYKRDIGRRCRDGSDRRRRRWGISIRRKWRRGVSRQWRWRRNVSRRQRRCLDISSRRRWRRDVSSRRLIGGHSVRRRKRTFEHLANGRYRTYRTLQRR